MKYIVKLLLLLALAGCGSYERPPLPKDDLSDYVLIGYDITKDGTTIMYFPFEMNSESVNGVVVSERIYGPKDIYDKHQSTIIHTTSNITLDKQSCPEINGYTFVKKCMYIIAHNTRVIK